MQTAKQVPCDQCHERRVKCKGPRNEPCNGCAKSNLRCTRLLVRRKRGPKTSTRSKKAVQFLDHADNSTHTPGIVEDNVIVQLQNVESDTTSCLLPRAFAITSRSNSINMTVNELANTILSPEIFPFQESSVIRWPDSRAEIGFPTSPHHSPSLVRPSVSLPRPSATPQDSQHFLEDAAVTLTEDLMPNSFNRLLDGTSLAIAVGLPLRYASELTHCVEAYFRHTHHVLFVVNEQSILAMLTCPSEMSILQRSLLLSICAVAKLKRWCVGDFQDRLAKELGCVFLERALQFRSSIDYMEQKSPMTVVASYLLHLSYACLNKPQSARLFMQEAICRALDMGLHSGSDDENTERICARRTLALLYVTERATVILNDCNAILLRDPPPVPIASFDEEDRLCLEGFRSLFNLFALLDVGVVEYWCAGKLRSERQRSSLYLVLHKIQHELSTISFDHVLLSDEQRADVLVTQEWLRLICWQTSMRLGYLSSQAADPCFSYDYPVDIASKICGVLKYVPDSALRAHHFSIYCKLFEIAYSLMDVLTLAGRQASSQGSRELKVLFRYLSKSPIKEMRFVRILMEKERNNSRDDEIHTDPEVPQHGMSGSLNHHAFSDL